MADELEAIRQRRMAELSSQYGVRAAAARREGLLRACGAQRRRQLTARTRCASQGKVPSSQEELEAEEQRKRCAPARGTLNRGACARAARQRD
jgi:hypothetical protein